MQHVDPQQETFIVIDDASMNNQVCRVYIQALYPNADIQTFTDPVAGLNYIQQTYGQPHAHKTIIFLDIDMPGLTGWDVLDRFSKFPETMKRQFVIYIHSSSIDEKDITRAARHPLISGFIEKPLQMPQLQNMLSRVVW
jgi:two-component system, chemotaxis family, chemotaxis protein CheY